VVVAGLQLTGCTRLGLHGSKGSSGAKTNVQLTFLVPAADPGLVNGFRVGDQVRIKDTGSVLGKITAVDASPTLIPTPTSDGRVVASAVPDQVDIRVTVAGSPTLAQDGYRFDGDPVWVNSDLKLVSTLTYCEAKVLSITEAGK
jgi:hypothetical protein